MKKNKAELIVLGGGPGGYTAAFYAADRGKQVMLVEKEDRLGGVCLQRGCIPSKALLHAVKVMREARESALRGIVYEEPAVNYKKLHAWKDGILEKLSVGIEGLAKRRGVEILHGRGHFEESNVLRVETKAGQKFIEFDKAIIASGSKPAIPAAFDLGNKRIMTSTEALNLPEIPKNLLVIGGGYIGLELGTVYASLGTRIVLVEALKSILPGVDSDLANYVMQDIRKRFKEVRLNTPVSKMATRGKQIKVTLQVEDGEREEYYDRVLVAVGRIPNSQDLGLENTKVKVDDKGFVQVNDKQETADASIYAIGDIAGGAMLAHKASYEARVAIDTLMGEAASSKNKVLPAVVFTDPEIAWCGLTESEAREREMNVKVLRFPWASSGRALTLDRIDGMSKLVVEPETERILGMGIVGHGAGELISEGVLAIEMGATAKDLAESIHPHPTLSETWMETAELFYGFSTHRAVDKNKS